MKELGIEVQRFYQYFDQKLYTSMKLQQGIFFDRETFGQEKLVLGPDNGDYVNSFVPVQSVAQMPIDAQARKDLVRLHVESIDYLPGLTPEEKRARLATVSYKDFLLQIAKVHPQIVEVYQTLPHDLYCVGIDAVSAIACRQMGYPGFKGMKIASRHHREEDDEEGEEEPTSSTSLTGMRRLRVYWCGPWCRVRPPGARWKTSSRRKWITPNWTSLPPRFAFG